jgi:hypothetical protein
MHPPEWPALFWIKAKVHELLLKQMVSASFSLLVQLVVPELFQRYRLKRGLFAGLDEVIWVKLPLKKTLTGVGNDVCERPRGMGWQSKGEHRQ